MVFNEYQEIVGISAGVATVAQFFTPVFICRDIIKQKGTNNIDPTPFIGGIGLAFLFLQHGILLKDPAMIPVNIVGITLNIIYLSVFYTYTEDKFKVFTSLGKVLLGVAVLIGYAQIENPERVEFNFGLIVTVLLFVLIGAPLLNLKEILRSKDASALPFPLIAGGTLNSVLWLLYGIIIENIFLQFQNIVGGLLCITQLTLCFMYPGPLKSSKKIE